MPFDPHYTEDIHLATLAQLAPGGAWELELPHDRGEHLLIWITRGQGRGLLNGARSGMGTHNALFIPARTVFSLEIARQGYGQALVIPQSAGMTLPQQVRHLRIRDVAAQNELTATLEALGREQSASRALSQSAVRAYAELAAIWLRRQLAQHMEIEPPVSAGLRLTRAFCDRVVTRYASTDTINDFAAALDVTPTHLTRVCRAHTGKTAAVLLSQRRLHAARRLLTATTVPVKDIARHLGFGSAAYFTRFMQQHTGLSPRALRSATTGPRH